MLGAGGERWVPVHGLFPHGRVLAFHQALQDYWRANRETMERFSIRSGTMFLCVGPNAFLYEPTFVWPDARTAYHARALPADYLGRLPEHPAAPDAFEAVKRMKGEVARLMDAHGAAHFQVGRFYDYARGRDPAALALLRALKAALDPHRILSPGALGL
jgi:D-lactate dehydrogenase (cytochrome)